MKCVAMIMYTWSEQEEKSPLSILSERLGAKAVVRRHRSRPYLTLNSVTISLLAGGGRYTLGLVLGMIVRRNQLR